MMEESPANHHSPVSHSYVTLNDLQIITGSITAILKESFGPKGQFSLLISNTGTSLMVKDGCNILLSLHMTHPMAKMVQHSVKNFIDSYGDGAKTILMYINALFQALEKDMRKQTTLESNFPALKNQMTKTLRSFLKCDLPALLADVNNFIKGRMQAAYKTKDISWILFHVVSTFLNGCISYHIVPQIAKIVMEYLTHTCTNLNDYNELIRWFSTCLCVSPTKSYSASYVDYGVFLQRPLLYKDKEITSFNLICMLCNVDGTLSHDQEKDICLLKDPDQTLHHRLKSTKRFLNYLRSLDVSLILCSSKVPSFALQLCQVSGVAVIDCIEESDIDFICYITKKLPVTSCFEDIASCHILTASSCHQYVEGHTTYSKLNLEGELLWQPRSVFLCAPTEALGKHLKEALGKCMIMLSHLFNGDCQDSLPLSQLNLGVDNHSSPMEPNFMILNNIVCGGGYFEIVMCHFLCDFKNRCQAFNKRWCCEILEEMLLVVPYSLWGSLSNQRQCSKGYIEILQLMQEKDRFIDETSGFNALCQQGIIVDSDIFEVLSIKTAMFCSGLSTATCLLNLDSILSVSGAVQTPQS